MKNSNLLDAISFPRTVLKLTGNWPEKNSSNFTKINGLINFLIPALFVVTLFMEVVKHFDNYQMLSEHLCITTSPTSFFVKLIAFKCNEKHFLKLYDHMNDPIFSSHESYLDHHIVEAIKMTKFIGKLFQWMCTVVIGLYIFMPIFTASDLPIKFSYELGSWKIVMYIFQSVALSNAGLVNSCLDVLIVGMMTTAAAQIKICNEKILTCTSRTIIEKNKKTVENDFKIIKTLKECVIHHNEIIRYVSYIEKVISPIVLIQYLTSVIVICNIGFQLVHVQPGSIQFANMFFYFNAMMIQLGMYCWYGNEVILVSLATGDACYQCDWPECTLKVRKLLFIIIEHSKKPIFLTAGKFSKLSLVTFTSVINSSYSFFALMQRLYAKSKI